MGKKCMNEPLLILQRQIENDLQIIAAIYQNQLNTFLSFIQTIL